MTRNTIDLLTTLLFAVSLRVQALQCVCDYSPAVCSHEDTCEVENEFNIVHCDVAVDVYLDNSIKAIHHNCIDDFIQNECRTHPSISPDRTYTTYYACCNERDFCNKCILPEELPYEARKMMGFLLDPDCNFTLPQPSLSSSLSPSLIPTESPILTTSTPSDNYYHYINAAIAVGCTTVVCLAAISVLVLVVWCTRRQKLSRRRLRNSPVQTTDYDEVTCTTTISDGNNNW